MIFKTFKILIVTSFAFQPETRTAVQVRPSFNFAVLLLNTLLFNLTFSIVT